MGEPEEIAPRDLIKEMKGKLDHIEEMLNKVSEKQRTRWILTVGWSGFGVFFGAGLGTLIAGVSDLRQLRWFSIIFFVAAFACIGYCLRMVTGSQTRLIPNSDDNSVGKVTGVDKKDGNVPTSKDIVG